MPTSFVRKTLIGLFCLGIAVMGMRLACVWSNQPSAGASCLVPWVISWVSFWTLLAGFPRLAFWRCFAPASWDKKAALLASLLVAAAMLRIYNVYGFPAFLHNDEMSVALQARKFLSSSPPSPLGVGWAELPNLHAYLNSFSLRIFGDGVFGARMNSVVLGLLSLPAAFLLASDLFGVGTGFFLLALTVPFHWHVHFSRIATCYMWAGATTVWVLFLFRRALDTKNVNWFAWTGFCLGIGLQSYYATRLIPFIVVAWATLHWIYTPSHRSSTLKGTAITLALAAWMCIPLAMTLADNPSAFWSRSRAVSIFSPENAAHLAGVTGAKTLAGILRWQVAKTIGLFYANGVTELQYAFNEPFISPILRPLFFAGVLYAIARARELRWLFLWSWVLATLVAGSVLTVDAPTGMRTIGISTIILIFPAVILASLFDAGTRLRESPWLRRFAQTALVTLCLLSAGWEIRAYFVRYAALRGGARRDGIIRLIDSELPETAQVINLFSNAPEDFAYQSYQFVTPRLKGINVSDPGVAALEEHLGRAVKPTLIVYSPADPRSGWLKNRFPNGRSGSVDSTPNQEGFAWRLVP